MRTITNEVGFGPIKSVAAPDPNDLSDRLPAKKLGRGAGAWDGKRERYDPTHRWTPQMAGLLVSTLDNGPVLSAANDNNANARRNLGEPTQKYPLKELYNRGELGINETENRRHWFDSQRFKQLLIDSRGEQLQATAQDEWRELLMPFLEGFSRDVIGSMTADPISTLSDDMEFEDCATVDSCSAVDFARWDVFRDIPPAAQLIQAQQTVALAANVLGSDFPLLCAAIDRGWTARMVGETEGFTDRASASACGKGMIRSALRNLSRFYVGLQRLEWGLEGAKQIWPIVGTDAWRFVELNDHRWAA